MEKDLVKVFVVTDSSCGVNWAVIVSIHGGLLLTTINFLYNQLAFPHSDLFKG